ncbi:MAG: hypothetical protein KME16_03065 [Scytolyngbya sp. HA4215-MV1]|nr:hypothetical protein [Scytolyngbya sp. HA4215-MV1]
MRPNSRQQFFNAEGFHHTVIGSRIRPTTRSPTSSRAVNKMTGALLPVARKLSWYRSRFPFVLARLLNQLRHQSSPPSLMTGSDSSSIVTVKIFVEQNEILPVGVSLKLSSTTIHRSLI